MAFLFNKHLYFYINDVLIICYIVITKVTEMRLRDSNPGSNPAISGSYEIVFLS